MGEGDAKGDADAAKREALGAQWDSLAAAPTAKTPTGKTPTGKKPATTPPTTPPTTTTPTRPAASDPPPPASSGRPWGSVAVAAGAVVLAVGVARRQGWI